MSNSSIGKILPSLASAAPELTLALANFNFDFTLYKAPAPPEYHGLGNSLSSRRKKAAEDGHEHIVARKLTRLFHKHIPEVPSLLAAYGDRASRIANTAGTLKGSKKFGVFADHVGLDGTSIWAAATSSQEALCLHLLACMLARIWSGPQATAIWAEIVEERQKELQKLPSDDPLRLSDLAAASVELSRDDLASWDASARSWLAIADDIMKKEQTQLLLLVDRTTLPVDLSPGVYKSVIGAWKEALTTIDNICGGLSYEIRNGAVLVGLASWHLFPDMYVLGGGQDKMIEQSDPVVKDAGILTFGLECNSATAADDNEGLRWSLPLAHLRFYGDPVEISRTMSTGTLRLTLSDFHLVVLGCMLARWGVHGEDMHEAAKLITTMWQFIATSASNDALEPGEPLDHHVALFPKRDSWFRILADAAESLTTSEGLQRQAMESLVARGSRRFVTFLAPAIVSPEPMFGLGTLKDIIPILYEEGVVNILRKYVSEAGLNSDHLIIRYKHTEDPMDNDPEAWVRDRRAKALQEKWGQMNLPELPVQMDSNHGLDGLLDQDFFVKKNDQADKLNTTTSSRKRPFNAAPPNHRGTLPNRKSKRFKASRPFRRDGFEYATVSPVSRDGAAPCHERWIEVFEIAGEQFDELQTIEENIQYFPTGTIMEFDELNFTWRAEYGEDVNDLTWELHKGHILEDRDYTFLVGIPEIGAIYRKINADVDLHDDLEIHEVKEAFEVRDVNPKRFLEHLSNLGQEKGKRNRFQPSPLVRSLRGVAAVTGVYKIMPNATITTSVFTKQLHEALWLDDTSSKLHTETARSLTPSTPGGNAANEMTNVVQELHSQEEFNFEWLDDTSSKLHNETARSLTPSTPGGNAANKTTNVVQELHSQEDFNFEWLLKYPMNRSRSFACIAMFENASLNIDPQGLGEVMALSAANSIYVAMPLLCDPYVQPHEHEVKHVIGNIGRPGVTFMVPPPNPMARKDNGWDLSSNHLPFDGSFEDKFKSSSLHLSFTKYQIPLSQTRDGGQDVEAYFLQSLVRLHGPDGKWVADLDVLGSLNSPQFQRLTNPQLKKCKHEKSRKQKPAFILKSIDSWAAFLDRPKLPGVVRATGNWLARLAAASLNVQLGYPVLVLPDNLEYYCQEGESKKNCIKDDICWACVLSHFNLEPRRTRSTTLYQNNYKLESMPFFIA